MPPIGFTHIEFGLLDAKNEVQQDRALLLDGYFDLHGAYGRVIHGHDFLVLGYKGSGKSALAQHMGLKAATDSGLTVKTVSLNQLSFQEFESVIPGESDWQARFPKVWSLLLWLQLLDLFRSDKESPSQTDPAFRTALVHLESNHLLPAKGIAESVRDYVNHALAVDTPEHSGTQSMGRLTVVTNLVNHLSKLATEDFRSGRRFLLVIDGTDEIFTGDNTLFEVITSLIESASSLNCQLSGSDTRAKIVVLCRTDLFNRLPGANKNKLRRDRGIELNWYEDSKDLHRSALAKLATLKAQVADPTIQDVFKDYLPDRLTWYRREHITLQLLLDHTRHTPRDLLQTLNSIRRVVDINGPGTNSRRLSADRVRRGLSRYSKLYFAAEIQDEVWGHLDEDERQAIVPILTTIGESRFSPERFSRVAEASFPGLNPTRLLQVLFDCSAVGNVRDLRQADSGVKARLTFKYRNPEANLNLEEDLLVHKGWRTKLGIVETPEKGVMAQNRARDVRPQRTRARGSRIRTRKGVVVKPQSAPQDSPATPQTNMETRATSSKDGTAPRRGRRRASREQGPPGV